MIALACARLGYPNGCLGEVISEQCNRCCSKLYLFMNKEQGEWAKQYHEESFRLLLRSSHECTRTRSESAEQEEMSHTMCMIYVYPETPTRCQFCRTTIRPHIRPKWHICQFSSVMMEAEEITRLPINAPTSTRERTSERNQPDAINRMD